jgi:hypothetical protein
MLKGFQLHGADSLAIEALAGPMPARYTTTTALVIPGVDPEANLAAGRWLGVYPQGDSGWELRETRVVTKKIFDECIGRDEGIPGTSPEGARFAMSELLGVTSGPVEAFWTGHDFVRPGDTLAVTRGGRRATLRATGRDVDTMNTRLYLDYRLWLKVEEGSVVESTSVWSGQFSETYPTIHWVGDLNSDQFPDVLIAVPGDGYGFRYRLLLSERGTHGVAFRTAAEVQVSDC